MKSNFRGLSGSAARSAERRSCDSVHENSGDMASALIGSMALTTTACLDTADGRPLLATPITARICQVLRSGLTARRGLTPDSEWILSVSARGVPRGQLREAVEAVDGSTPCAGLTVVAAC